MIQLIVEGHGETTAAPILVERILWEFQSYDAPISRQPIRWPSTQLCMEQGFKKSLTIAASKHATTSILVLFDLDKKCARDIAPQLHMWASEHIAHIPVGIVLARREFEAWFLASIESLRGHRGILIDAAYDKDPEATSGAKGVLISLTEGKSYSETSDMPALARVMDIRLAYSRSSSFRKLITEIRRLLEETGRSSIIQPEWL